jgi:UDP-N-acetylmuramoyl-tripeptide--D-alanyl-D-alanine ligase
MLSFPENTEQKQQSVINNHIGVPLTLLSFQCKTEIGIVKWEPIIRKLNFFRNCGADYGYITEFLVKTHLEGFGGVAGVIE